MATVDFVSIPAQVPSTVISALAAGASTIEQALGSNVIFLVNADQDITVRFGYPGFGTSAGTSDYRIPANTPQRFDTGRNYTSLKFYNLGQLPANIYIMFISKF